MHVSPSPPPTGQLTNYLVAIHLSLVTAFGTMCGAPLGMNLCVGRTGQILMTMERLAELYVFYGFPAPHDDPCCGSRTLNQKPSWPSWLENSQFTTNYHLFNDFMSFSPYPVLGNAYYLVQSCRSA